MKLIIPKEGEPRCQPDPYILKARGKYYIYSTYADGVNVYRADSLTGEYAHISKISFAGKKEYWAPAVIELSGKFYMYVSTMNAGEDDVHRQAIGVAVSDSPEGGFEYKGEILPPFSIDPHVVESGGKLYMFYSVNDYEAERAGTYIVADEMEGPLKMRGAPAAVVRPTLDEEIFMRDRFVKGRHWHTLEGAFYFRRGGWHYLMYSGNCYQSPYYYVGYAAAQSKETDLTKVPFTKRPAADIYAPVLMRGEGEEGTGHNSVIEENGWLYAVYHARDVGAVSDGEDTRTARICRLDADEGVLKAEKILNGTRCRLKRRPQV